MHTLSCLWIKLGSLDFIDERWKDDSVADKTWMFIEGTGFSNDPRTIYEQVIDA